MKTISDFEYYRTNTIKSSWYYLQSAAKMRRGGTNDRLPWRACLLSTITTSPFFQMKSTASSFSTFSKTSITFGSIGDPSPKVMDVSGEFRESFHPRYTAMTELNHISFPVRGSSLIAGNTLVTVFKHPSSSHSMDSTS